MTANLKEKKNLLGLRRGVDKRRENSWAAPRPQGIDFPRRLRHRIWLRPPPSSPLRTPPTAPSPSPPIPSIPKLNSRGLMTTRERSTLWESLNWREGLREEREGERDRRCWKQGEGEGDSVSLSPINFPISVWEKRETRFRLIYHTPVGDHTAAVDARVLFKDR